VQAVTEPALECGMRPIHPGEILRDELTELGLSARAFARALGIPTNRVTQILNERRGISADTALGSPATSAPCPSSGWICRATTSCAALAASPAP
jgi:hypothetical protein